ncbi:MAG: hypothetical protein ACE5FG_15315 [Myxococcota bacterium]
MHFAGGDIDALIVSEGIVLRTADPDATLFGVAQVRRMLAGGAISATHLVFAPTTPRPLLLALVRLNNHAARPVRVDYTELWDVKGAAPCAGAGAVSCETPEGARALADASLAVRAVPPEGKSGGLALDLRIALPPASRRELCFAYAAPPPDESPALLVRAWRGDVAAELSRTVAGFVETLGAEEDPVEAYRRWAATLRV